MVDFLKAYPFITMEQYYWGLTAPMVRLMAYDATKVIYLSEKQAEKYSKARNVQRIDNPMDMLNDLGMPVFNNKKK